MKEKISNDNRKYEDMVYRARKIEKEKRRKKNENQKIKTEEKLRKAVTKEWKLYDEEREGRKGRWQNRKQLDKGE